ACRTALLSLQCFHAACETPRTWAFHRSSGHKEPSRGHQADGEGRDGCRIEHVQHRSDHLEKGAVQAEIFGPRQEGRAYAARLEGAAQFAVRAFTLKLIGEE